MGNRQQLRPIQRDEYDDEDNVQHIRKKNKTSKKIIQIQPYNQDAVDTGFVSPIQGYLPVQHEELFVKRPEQLGNQNIIDYVIELEQKFDDQTISTIMQDFMKQSRENVIGKTRFLRFIGIENEPDDDYSSTSSYSSDCQFIQVFFKSCLRILDQGQTGQYMDYSKLLKVLHLIKYGQQNEQLEFIFSLFDINSDGKVERDDLNYFFTIFFEFLLQTPFADNNSDIEQLKMRIQKNKEKDIAFAIKKISDEMNQKYSNREGHMTYELWQQLMKNEYLNYEQNQDEDQFQKSNNTYDVSSYIIESNTVSPNIFALNQRSKQNQNNNSQSFVLDSSNIVNSNVFTNIQRDNNINQNLSTETDRIRREEQII